MSTSLAISLDAMGGDNAPDMVIRGAEIARLRFPNVRLVLCGHVHRTVVRRWAGTVVVACPSTATEIALQLAPGAVPQSFLGPPACLLHLWNPQQGLVNHVSYTGRYPGPYPFF